MYRFFDDVIMPIIICGAVLAILAVGVVGFAAGYDYLDCRGFHNGTGYETRWWWGCYAKVDGEWMPKEYIYGKVNELRLKDKREKKK